MPTPDPKDANPYRSPKASLTAKGDASSVDIFTATSAFEVGEKEKHEIRITWSIWSGEEIYEVDNEEVKRIRSFDVSGVRELEVGDEEKHLVEVRFRSFPFNVAQVYVDGRRRIRNLFPRLSLLIWAMAAVIFIPLGIILAWLFHFR